MSLSSMWDAFSLWAMHFGMPLVQCYHIVCASPFLNVELEDATGVEKAANVALSPVQYLLAGKKALRVDSTQPFEGRYEYVIDQRFVYRDDWMWTKTALSFIALPASLTFGSALKGVAMLSKDTRVRYDKMIQSAKTCKIDPQTEYYNSIGIEVSTLATAEMIEKGAHKRRPGEENVLADEKLALKQIVKALSDHNIMFWADCGTCLGAYRYGGAIPWDWDVDIAILQKDSDNVKNILSSALDPEHFVLQDWSSRDKPRTYLKVYVKATGSLIDIYHFAIDEQNQTIYSILSNGDCVFLPESWKIRERRFTIPTSFDIVFPLKKASFDGIEVLVPGKTKEYLQQRYGQNIEPVKIFNEITGQYEKDLSHPYWQRSYVQ